MTQTFVILESCVLSNTVRSQVDRIDPVVKSRRRQETYEPKTGVWTVDKGNKVAWIPLQKETRSVTEHDFMTGKLSVSNGP
jgi:hypothetical protein